MNTLLSLISQVILLAFAVWLLCVAYYALSAPNKAKLALRQFGSTPLIHFGEHILRTVVGLAFVGAAEEANAYSLAFNFIGAFLIGSSLIIMILPRRWHHAYASYWAEKLSKAMVQIAGLFTIFAAVILVQTLPIAAIEL